ncbi:zinc ribbon domain-containing protein [Verrucomicrobium sp. 3C]|uniref:zinc ribbon domain-containing protein n=1 Tax=Verrucomicrobium sp. 3C TaxID=1134055 RepID=UPI001E49A91C|nr:C4-type zinc ribbon domain-containing protein [Verrucomicrobium sp. 3C]
MEGELEEAKQKLHKAKLEQQASELVRRQKEGEIDELRRQLARYQTQQLQARKNEEYQALSHEILVVTGEIEREEDNVLLLLEKADILQANVKREEQKAEQAEKEIQGKKKELADKESRLALLLAETESERERKKIRVDPALFGQYQRLVHGRRENAVVSVVHGSCGGCHMKLTRHTLLRVEVATEIAFCENCGRILFAIP